MGQTHGAKVRCRGIIYHEGKVLVVRQQSVVCLPGGTLEKGETPLETIAREIKEELGIKPTVGDVKAILTFDISDKKRRIEFVYEILNGEDFRGIDQRGQASHGFELDEIMWRSVDDLGEYFLPGELRYVQEIMERDEPLYLEIVE